MLMTVAVQELRQAMEPAAPATRRLFDASAATLARGQPLAPSPFRDTPHLIRTHPVLYIIYP